jgi:hypothetical protein
MELNHKQVVGHLSTYTRREYLLRHINWDRRLFTNNNNVIKYKRRVTILVRPQLGSPRQRFPTQWLSHAQTYVGLHLKCLLLLSNFNPNCNASENFSKVSQ